MALSAYERNLLEQLEKQFSVEDPEFAAAMEPEPARSRNALRILAGAATVLSGFLLILLGATLQGPVPNVLLGVLGFATMIAGGFLAARGSSGTTGKGHFPAAHSKERAGPTKKAEKRRSFRDGFGDLAVWSLFWWV